MNERIQELFKQAYGYFPAPTGELETEKFTQLVIEECAKFLDERSDYDNFVAKVAPLLGKPKI